MFIRKLSIVFVLAVGMTGGLSAQPTLIAHWDFESGAGSVLVDQTANSHDGNLFGGPAWVPSSVAGGLFALQFSNGKAVKVPNHPDLLPGDHSYTFSAWFKSSVTNAAQTITWAQRGCCNNTSVLTIVEGPEIAQYSYHNDRLICCGEAPETVRVNSQVPVTDGEWHHVVAVRDRDDGMAYMYFDGVLVDSESDSNANINTTSTIGIGHRPSDAIGFDQRFFQGLLDEIMIYDGALSAGEIAAKCVAEEPSPGICDVPDTVVLSSNSVWLKQNSSIQSGNVVVTDASAGPTLASNVELTVGDSVDVASDIELKADSVKVKVGAVVDGDVYYNDLDNNGTINGTLNTPLDLPTASLPSFESAPAGALDVLVPQGGSSTLAPGDYGDIQIKKNGKLVFLGGEYNIRSLNGGQACELLFADAATIRIEDKFDTDKNTVIGPDAGAAIDASDIVFYVAGINGNNGNLGATPKAAQIGLANTVAANFHVPNGTLWIRQNTAADGAFVGKDVIVGIGVTVSLDSAF